MSAHISFATEIKKSDCKVDGKIFNFISFDNGNLNLTIKDRFSRDKLIEELQKMEFDNEPTKLN